MLFSSLSYLLFFPAVLLAFWLLPHRFRNVLLLVSSYYFYMSWIPVYGILLFVLTLLNYALGAVIDRHRQHARAWLVTGIVLNLSTLAYFKYTDFAIASFNKAVASVSPILKISEATLSLPLQHVLLPLGISFFVFEFIHYIVDVYKGSKPITNYVNFSLFAAFFPSQIAGPIKRYQDFIKQMQEPRRFLSANFERGLLLLLQGLFKKIALADNLSPVVNQGFAHAATLGGADAWVAALAFAAQIYCDFSGYTDMGRGSALMLGFDLPDNFNLPYIARSLTDFWKRWHISLSSWLRDYLYIPLGGSKCSLVRRHANLLITMVLGGLWHGASWHFVVWGAFHGTGLILCHSYDHWLKNSSSAATGFLRQLHSTATGGVLSMLLTFVFVLVGWVFFRAETMADAMSVLHGMFAPQSVTSGVLVEVLAQHPIVPALLAYLVYRLVCDYGAADIKVLPAVAAQICTPRVPARIVVYLAFFVMTMALAPSSASPFIYFAF